MIIYLVLLILICFYGIYMYSNKNSKQSRKLFLTLSFFSMTIVLGLRGQTVGEDTAHYLNVFDNAKNIYWHDIFFSHGFRTSYFTDQFGYTDTIENGFLAFCKIIHWFTDNGQIFLFILAALTCFLFAKFIYDNTENVFFPTYIFLCESTFMLAFNGARQLFAAAIAIQSYQYLKKKKLVKAILVIILATLIHNSSIICFLIFPILLVKPKQESKLFKYSIIATVLSPVVIYMLTNIIAAIFPRYASYFTTNYWLNSLGGVALLWVIEFSSIMLIYKKKFKVPNSFGLSSIILYYLACELIGLEISAFSRIAWFFRPYLMLFFPKLELYFSKKTRRVVRCIIIFLITILYFKYAITSARTYQFYWQQ